MPCRVTPLVAVAGAVLQRAGLKPHFLDAYLHVAAHVLFLTLLSGGWRWDDSLFYWLVLIALCAAAIGLGIRFSRFAFVVYGVIYGYAGVSSRILRNISAFSGGLAYFVVSGTMVIIALVVTAGDVQARGMRRPLLVRRRRAAENAGSGAGIGRRTPDCSKRRRARGSAPRCTWI